MRRIEDQIWAGSSSNFWMVKEAEESYLAALAAGWSDSQPDDEEDDPEDQHDLLQVVGNIGIVHISGGLVNDDSHYLKYYGLTGYPQIKAAVAAAARNADVKHILLNIDSGGGSVSGCQDTGDLIRKVNDNLKPVSAFTGGTMASAAYWLGSSAGSVYAAETAVVGSIGVLATHKEYSKMYAEAGIGVTVVRSGKYKALANSVEPLSKEGEAQLQNLVNATSAVFTNYVAKMRNRTPEYVDSTMGQGREFVGASAADVGLIDGITSLDSLVSKLQAQLIDTSGTRLDTRPQRVGGLGAAATTEMEMDVKNSALTDQEIAALKAKQEGQHNASTETVVENDAKADKVNHIANDALTASLEKANGDIVDLRVKLVVAEKELGELKAVIDPMKDLVAKSISTMNVALGGVAVDAASMTPAQLIAAHAATAEAFTKKFPAGGVAAVDAAQGEKTKIPAISALEQARLNAALKK